MTTMSITTSDRSKEDLSSSDNLPVHPQRNAYPPIADQFGMASLITHIRGIDRQNPFMVGMTMGVDFSTLNMTMNPRQRDSKYCTFGGPFVGNHRRMHDVPCDVPEEYRVSVLSKMPDPTGQLNSLLPFKEHRYSDEILFHVFYNFGGETYQLVAAAELYSRGWRYHKQQQIWITRSQFAVQEQTANHERAIYTFFDRNLWRKMTREMTIFFHDIEGRPNVPDMKDIQDKKC
ncbi:hypothetical protein QR680_010955 [Steinernema hermaphroditum]|uniref:NOT2/NOT3/NOT5 C-terminal domain-containing protein n=1 Tax=Steinernema hermaphroditum TaxID=289476 RepID=A0AA39ISE8_9BILA|nr:hypothetical protein QR680_010955 [Steinernema hermaphroditum]